MKFGRNLIIAATSLALLSACSEEVEEGPRQGVIAVGSSTVYPFAVAVGEALAAQDMDLAPVAIETIGTGEGIARFCAGAGPETPDIANASRRMTAKEFRTCQANGVTDIVEIPVGRDGIVFATAVNDGLSMALSPRLIYAALAARPFGGEQQALKWSDVDPSLPDESITVYGPPPGSGTRDALIELALVPGCETNGGMALLSGEEHVELCETLRADGPYIDQGEHDDVIVRKVAGNEHAVAVFGYSYAEENTGQVKALPVGGVAPNADTIADGSYPLSRPLYIYVKKAHLETVPGLAPYVRKWAELWGKGGRLAGIGLVPSQGEALATGTAAAQDMTPMTGEGLE